jgi:hypothetical protein
MLALLSRGGCVDGDVLLTGDSDDGDGVELVCVPNFASLLLRIFTQFWYQHYFSNKQPTKHRNGPYRHLTAVQTSLE